MSVSLFKLVTGEFIISDVVNESAKSTVTLSNPALIGFQPSDDGNPKPFIVQFIPFGDNKKVELYPSSIVAEVSEPDQQLVNYYNSIFGSGIVVANVMPGK